MSYKIKELKPKVMGLGDNRELFESSYEIVKRIFHIPYEHYKQLYEEMLFREELAKDSALREYEFAVSYGFTGTFEEYKKGRDNQPRGAIGPVGVMGKVDRLEK